MNVRRLAAIDMYGTRGTTRRRRIILAEFLVSVVVMEAIGISVLTHASAFGGRAFGLWLIGAGLNYAPLALHAIMLSRPGVLDAELAGVDPGPELRRYGVLQLWILVPLSLVVVAGHDALTRAGSVRARCCCQLGPPSNQDAERLPLNPVRGSERAEIASTRANPKKWFQWRSASA